MQKNWYNNDYNRVKDEDDEETRKYKEFNSRIVSNMKPYFMCYIYPQTMKLYKKYIKESNSKSRMDFRLSINDLLNKDNLTKPEKEMLEYYYAFMPVGMGSSLINRICRKVENSFAKTNTNVFDAKRQFDYSILKGKTEYDPNTYKKVFAIYEKYNSNLQQLTIWTKKEHVTSDDLVWRYHLLETKCIEDCDKICPNDDELCNIVLDMCYTKEKTKQFAWEMCGKSIINNLLRAGDNTMQYPVNDDDGDITYRGHNYIMKNYRIEDDE